MGRMFVALQALRELGWDGLPDIRVLEGGFDQWARRFWNDPQRVQGYDDEYWGFAMMDGTQLVEDSPPSHALYTRPAGQLPSPWNAVGLGMTVEPDTDNG